MTFKIHENWYTYQSTQMYYLLKRKELIVATVGNRKFIRKDSLDAFLMSRTKKELSEF